MTSALPRRPDLADGGGPQPSSTGVGRVIATSACAAIVDTSAWYVVVSRSSGKALDVYTFATIDGAARITQWSRPNADNQHQPTMAAPPSSGARS